MKFTTYKFLLSKSFTIQIRVILYYARHFSRHMQIWPRVRQVMSASDVNAAWRRWRLKAVHTTRGYMRVTPYTQFTWCNRLSIRLCKRFDNRLDVCIHDTIRRSAIHVSAAGGRRPVGLGRQVGLYETRIAVPSSAVYLMLFSLRTSGKGRFATVELREFPFRLATWRTFIGTPSHCRRVWDVANNRPDVRAGVLTGRHRVDEVSPLKGHSGAD